MKQATNNSQALQDAFDQVDRRYDDPDYRSSGYGENAKTLAKMAGLTVAQTRTQLVRLEREGTVRSIVLKCSVRGNNGTHQVAFWSRKRA